MSTRDSQVFDAVLTLFDKVYPLTTTQHRFVSGDKIKSTQLPFGQCFGSVHEQTEDIYLQTRELVTFRLEVIDVQANRAALQTAFAAFAVAIARNQTLGGIVTNTVVSPASVAETGDNEMCRFAADLAYELSSLARNLDVDTQWVPLAGNASLVTKSSATDTVTNNTTFIPGGIDYKKVVTNVIVPAIYYTSGSWFPPIDASKLKTIRLLVHVPPLEVAKCTQLGWFFYHQTTGINAGIWMRSTRAGWNHHICDLDVPSSSSGTGWNREGSIARFGTQFWFLSAATVSADPITIYRMQSSPGDER